MNRVRWLLLLACGLLAGCGGNPTPQTLDEPGEAEFERQQQEAANEEAEGGETGEDE